MVADAGEGAGAGAGAREPRSYGNAEVGDLCIQMGKHAANSEAEHDWD